MASTELTEYERRRLENIKRNEEMIASLNIHSTLSSLSSSSKRQRPNSSQLIPEKKHKAKSPLVIRQSLRARGRPPESEGLKFVSDQTPTKSNTLIEPKTLTKSQTLKLQAISAELIPNWGVLSTKEAYIGTGSDETLYKTILEFTKNSPVEGGNVKNEEDLVRNVENEEEGVWNVKNEVSGSVDLDAMKLEPENIAKVMPGRVVSLKFFPVRDKRMIVAGSTHGKVGFWNVDYGNKEGDEDGIYLYRPHLMVISGILIQPCSMSKMITCSYDGNIRLMDIERETFSTAYSATSAIYSVSYWPNDLKSLYFGEGDGKLGIWDERSGKSSRPWTLHDECINTIDFSSGNTNLMATSSTDGTACIWDIRNINAKNPKPLKVVRHSKDVNSAYFSPSGSLLATTSLDDKIGLISGANYDDVSMIFHKNHSIRCCSSFRAVWGWDDSCLFVGCRNRGINVISTAVKKEIATLRSKNMYSIQCRFDAHPFNAGVLATSTKEGLVCVWNS